MNWREGVGATLRDNISPNGDILSKLPHELSHEQDEDVQLLDNIF